MEKSIKKQSYITSFYFSFKLTIFIIFLIIFFSFYDMSTIETFRKNNKPFNGRIFVSFMYNNEAEMAYIHIWRLYDYVDKFIFIVSNKTFSNNPKNFSFVPFEENIKPYMDKIAIANFDNICNGKEYPSDNLPWCLEKSQRDYAKTFIEKHYSIKEDDLLIVVDIDEILTREGIQYIKKNPPYNFYFIKGSMYFPYYYHKVEDWDKGFVIRYNTIKTTLSKYRDMKQKNNILKYKLNPSKPLITHCSFCFKKLEQYKDKIISFPHQEFNKPPYITNNWIFKSHYCRAKINSFLGYDEPYEGWRHLIPDDSRLKYLLDPSFMYPLNLTTYTKEDLKNMCYRKYRRTPFE